MQWVRFDVDLTDRWNEPIRRGKRRCRLMIQLEKIIRCLSPIPTPIGRSENSSINRSLGTSKRPESRLSGHRDLRRREVFPLATCGGDDRRTLGHRPHCYKFGRYIMWQFLVAIVSRPGRTLALINVPVTNVRRRDIKRFATMGPARPGSNGLSDVRRAHGRH